MAPTSQAGPVNLGIARRVCLVTGGASGFGAALAEKLARAVGCFHNAAGDIISYTHTVSVLKGAIVAVADRNEELGRKLVQEFEEKYAGELDIGFFVFIKVDLSKLDEVKRMVDAVVRRYGTIDILVNNAGIGDGDTWFLRGDSQRWVDTFGVNTHAAIYATQLVINEIWKKPEHQNRGGVVVNTASMAAFDVEATQPVYGATKAAVVAFTRSLASLAKSHNIRVNCVCPAASPTPLFLGGMNHPRLKESFAKYQKEGWIVPVDLVAEALLYGIVETTLAGAVIRVVPKNGIELYDYKTSKAVKAEWPRQKL
ncbi:NAD(P)-binding protein [Gonapodya prolifera JEL478]|uniref:NAD(P)-binding protein n=1 Tax=Gonapodya prolifera (strain JEL478) TaxID=1344416 RepID=A0A139AFC9_GONPJ|nr:NAD(P)-binding protein [Gonapodya prolifera JEL478]|eukprot:KXS15460.1 NAD(P)-binding protein [Gonapodya prolifera JEL478]